MPLTSLGNVIIIVAVSPTLTSCIGAVNTYSSSTPYLYLDTVNSVELEPKNLGPDKVILIAYVPAFKIPVILYVLYTIVSLLMISIVSFFLSIPLETTIVTLAVIFCEKLIFTI